MRIISFAWTTPALIAGRKTCTRREWNDSYARSFTAGEMLAAYDRSPRFKGRKVATIRLIANPCQEPEGATLPDGDWEAEGFAYLEGIGAKVNGLTPRQFWDRWCIEGTEDLWVVRFELVSVEPAPSMRPSAQGVLL